MVEIHKYHLKPTALIPNSPQPLLHYRGLLATKEEQQPAAIHKRFNQNSWQTQWIFRYGPTQPSHYHSRIHECMAVLSGSATIRFGVADTSDDLEENTHGGATEPGGLEIRAEAGDFFVIPAGVAHKTYDTTPAAPFALLTPGQGRGLRVPDPEDALSKVSLSGYTMMGAYPMNCGTWDFTTSEGNVKNFEASWDVPKPCKDPLLGMSCDGVVGQWKEVALPRRRDLQTRL